MTERAKILSWTGIGLGFAMAMLGLYRMFTAESPVGDSLVKLGILLILFSRHMLRLEGRGKRRLVCAIYLAAVILVLAGTFLAGGGPLSLGSLLKTGGLILGVVGCGIAWGASTNGSSTPGNNPHPD